MTKYKAVIFDMDGTLLDTLDDIHRSLNFALAKCGYKERTMSEVRAFIGDGMKMLVARAMPDEIKPKCDKDAQKFGLACATVGEEFTKYYIEHGEDYTVVYDGISDLLKALNANGVKTAVVSNKVAAAVDRLVENKLKGLFDINEGDREGIRLKPAPDMILSAISRLGLKGEDVVYVGDGEADIKAAAAAGVDLISVSYGYRTEEFLLEHGATRIAHSVGELKEMLGV